MNLKSEKSALLILAITSLILSRALFLFFNDPEGPNVLIVSVVAVVIFGVSLSAYVLKRPTTQRSRLLGAMLAQVVAVGGLYILGSTF